MDSSPVDIIQPQDSDAAEELVNIFKDLESETSGGLDSLGSLNKINMPKMEHLSPLDEMSLGSAVKNIAPELLAEFELSSTDKQRFQVVDKGFAHCGDGFDPNVGFHQGKSITEAESLLKSGLKLANAGKKAQALEMMAKAIVVAPWRTPQTPRSYHPYCFGDILVHRANLLYHMDRYSECLVDAEQALLHGSRGLRKEMVMMTAQVFLNSNRPSEAIDCLVRDAENLKIAAWEVANKERLAKEEAAAEACLVQKGISKEEKTQLRETLRKIREQLAKMEADQRKFEALLNRAKKEKKRAGRKNAQPPKPLIPFRPDFVQVLEEVKKLKLRKGRHPIFPAASAVCELKEDDALGRHFVTKRNLDVGDIVVIERAYVSCLIGESDIRTHCYACHLYTDVPQPCKTCSTVVFCSRVCVTSERAKLHKRECAFWLNLAFFPHLGESKSMLGAVSTCNLIMAVRVILMKTSKEWDEFFKSVKDLMEGEADDPPPLNKRFFSDDYRNVFWLKKKASLYSAKELCSVAICARGCLDFLEYVHFNKENKLSKDLRDNLGALIIRHMMSFTTNFHAITEVTIEERKTTHLGSMVLPTTHMFRFACCANLVAVPYADHVVVRATRRIQKGEVLTISPIGSIDIRSFKDRQAFMLEKFGIACDCRACVERWPAADIIKNQFFSWGFQVKCIVCGNAVCATAISCSECATEIVLTVRAVIEAYFQLMQFMTHGCRVSDRVTKPPGNLPSAVSSIRTIAALGLEPFYPKMYSQAVVILWAKLFGNKSP